MNPLLMALLMQMGVFPQSSQGQGTFPDPFASGDFNPFTYGGLYGQSYGQTGNPSGNRSYGTMPSQAQGFPGLPPQAMANAFHQNPMALQHSQAPTGLPTPMPFGGTQERRPRPFQPVTSP